ncbi:MAG: hypothetical protein R2727_08705 [Bacteroidales bacterium]
MIVPFWNKGASGFESNFAAIAASFATFRKYSSSVVEPFTPGTAFVTLAVPVYRNLNHNNPHWISYVGLGRLVGCLPARSKEIPLVPVPDPSP